MNKWHDYFKNLLGKVPDILDTEDKQVIEHQLDIKPGNFKNSEAEVSLKKHHNKKAMGHDNVLVDI